MHTRVLMISSAALLALAGIATGFFPERVLATHGTEPDNATVLLIHMMGALYLGFAFVNWHARGLLVGGIYGRPITIGNFVHFSMVAIFLWQGVAHFGVVMLAISASVFTVFAVWFAIVLFRPPVARRPDDS